MSTLQTDIDLIVSVNSADIEALEDARMTLNSIKKADPGTYDEIIDESLRLIGKALNISVGESIERIADQLGVKA
jgi:hypothetical protein